MATIDSSSYLASYGIAEASLSDEVKDGVNEVLRAAGTKALEQLGPILQSEAKKRGIIIGTPTTDKTAENETVQASLDELSKQQAKQQRQRVYLLVGALVLVVAGVSVYFLTRKRV
jgi:hypothetical protein